MKTFGPSLFRGVALLAASSVFFTLSLCAQESTPSAGQATADTGAAVRELQDQVRQLRALVEEMRAENVQSRAEMHQLRNDLQATRALLEKPEASESVAKAAPANATESASSATTAQPSPSLEDRVEKLEESTSLIGSKVDEQYQTKVETASRYRARLHGIILMNAFRNNGSSDNVDLPTYADPVSPSTTHANVGATLRQSEIGLEVFGPTVFGAKTSADLQLDFAGGFAGTGNGVDFGIARLQTANIRLDWQNTSLIAGQDQLFISPLSPTSFASLADPAFAFAGNLWAWTPQLRVEHRFSLSDQQTITMQAGVLDNLDWEPNYSSFYRTTQAGEASGQPAYAFRTAWSRPVKDRPLVFGAAGYYGRQVWSWDRVVDAWAGMADWQVPIAPRLALSGEFYRGRGIGGLGAAIGTSILYGGNPSDPATPIHGLDAAGGWAQLKFQLTPKLELNGAVSEDDAFAGDVRGFAIDANNFGPILGRNRGALGNIVYRPRSDLVLAAELRRLRSYPVYSGSSALNQLNLSMGILF